MGKYTKFKSVLPRMIGTAAPEGEEHGSNAWNDEVNKIKDGWRARGLSKEELTAEYLRLRAAKDVHERNAKNAGKDVEALNRLLVELIEAAGASGIKLADGSGVDIEDRPHSTVEDPRAFIKWIKANDMEDMLRLQWQTMNATVAKRLDAGLEPPPGVKVHLQSKVKRRKAKGEK